MEVISEVLEPHNLRNLVGNSNLISIGKLAKPKRNHKLILARFGIGYLGNTSFEKIGGEFGVSGTTVSNVVRRFEKFTFPMEKIHDSPYWICVTSHRRWNTERYDQYMRNAEFKEGFNNLLKETARMIKIYADPIKSDIYYRCLEKVCKNPNDVQSG